MSFFKLINIQSDRARIRFEQFARIGSLAPNGLFAIEHVVHLPKMTLEPGGFSSQRGLPSVLVSAEREMPEDEPHARVIFFQEFLSKRGRNCRRAGTENRQTLPASPGHRGCPECALIRSRYLPREPYLPE